MKPNRNTRKLLTKRALNVTLLESKPILYLVRVLTCMVLVVNITAMMIASPIGTQAGKSTSTSDFSPVFCGYTILLSAMRIVQVTQENRPIK